jgi:hypothetical protein
VSVACVRDGVCTVQFFFAGWNKRHMQTELHTLHVCLRIVVLVVLFLSVQTHFGTLPVHRVSWLCPSSPCTHTSAPLIAHNTVCLARLIGSQLRNQKPESLRAPALFASRAVGDHHQWHLCTTFLTHKFDCWVSPHSSDSLVARCTGHKLDIHTRAAPSRRRGVPGQQQYRQRACQRGGWMVTCMRRTHDKRESGAGWRRARQGEQPVSLELLFVVGNQRAGAIRRRAPISSVNGTAVWWLS